MRHGLKTDRYNQDLTSPQWKLAPGQKAASLDDLTTARTRKQTPSVRPTKYLMPNSERRLLLAAGGQLNLNAGGKRLRMNAPDAKQVIMIGSAEDFSCAWQNRRVLVNYKPGGKGDGELVTLELK